MSRGLALLLASLFLLPARAEVSTLWSVVQLHGTIKRGDHAQLVRELDKRKPRRLSIYAVTGGDEAEAARIGEEIARRGLPISVGLLCASPCAEHIFLRAPKRRLDADAFVLFLPLNFRALSMHAELRRQEGLPTLMTPEMEQRGRDAAARIDRLAEQLEQAGLAPDLLRFSEQLLRGSVRTATAWDAAPGDLQVLLGLAGSCRAWVPSASVLRSLGVAVEAERDARMEKFPRSEALPPATVYTGAPVPESDQAKLCAIDG